jgi:hypothetical protein
MLISERLSFLIRFKMTTKNKIYLVLSVLLFIATLFSILTSDVSIGMLDNTLTTHWIVLLIFTLLLPIFNLAEIILNRNDWNTFYWLGLVFNILTLFFVMRFFKIELLAELY